MALPKPSQEEIDQVKRDQFNDDTIDIFDLVDGKDESNPTANSYDLIRLSGDETAFMLFVSRVTPVSVHYVDTPDFKGYVRCNDDDCVLCQAGIKLQNQVLVPVYEFQSDKVGFLSISKKMSPYAALPQLLNILSSKGLDKKIVFINKPNNYSYKFTTAPLADNIESGEVQIKSFLEKFNKGEIDPKSVYQSLSNEQLSAIPEISRMLQLKGVLK